ncbi:hypothetical protein NQ317_016285 [Molorchus minor]|uniref:Novel acetylcholine receptor chaperone n=1 Tax=Molorchus minor TaxID=1323400 RepID=A0ABQ9IVT5_9CUCU|nr:hypothetical protein NQ317_016285 [Molorchus minor]
MTKNDIKMSSIVLRSLSILLGLFFVFVGLIKISSVVSKDLHKDLRKEYVKYAKVFPFSELLNFKVPSKWYRRVSGSVGNYLWYINGIYTKSLWPGSNYLEDLLGDVPLATVRPFEGCGCNMMVLHLTMPFRRKSGTGSQYNNYNFDDELTAIKVDKIKNASNICLLLLTLTAVYSHYMVADKLERTAPALVFLFMLSGRLVVYFQLQRREDEMAEPISNGFKQE